MVVDGFGSGFGLVLIFGSSLLVSSRVLCGTATPVLCGIATLVLYGTHHPLWLPFRLIGWFGLLVRFWDESLWFLVKVVRQLFGSSGLHGNARTHPFNELIFGLGF
jgi:hypothetical protein